MDQHGLSNDETLNLPYGRDPSLPPTEYPVHSIFGGAERFFPQIAASQGKKGWAYGRKYETGRCMLFLAPNLYQPQSDTSGALCMNDQGAWGDIPKCEIFSNSGCDGSGVAQWASQLNATAIAGANTLVERCVGKENTWSEDVGPGPGPPTDTFWQTPWCVNNYKHSAFLNTLAASADSARWVEPKVQDYCRTTYFAGRRNEAACKGGYDKFCTVGNRWAPPENHGDARCWEFAKEKLYSVSALARARCSVPGSLSDPFCFGPDSYVCSTDSNANKEFQRGNRYPWCNEVFTQLCQADGYGHKMCSCEKPFSTAEQQSLAAIGAADRSRYCVTTGVNPQANLDCRTGGYRLNPNESCQSICTINTAGLHFATVDMSNVTLMCADGSTLTLPPKFSTLDEMITWWVANKARYRVTGAPPTQADIGTSFATQITNHTSATVAQLRGLETKMNAIPAKEAGDTKILAAIAAKIAALEGSATKYEYVTTTTKRRLDLYSAVNVWTAADHSVLLAAYPVGTPFFFTRSGTTFQAVFNAWTDSATGIRSISLSKLADGRFVPLAVGDDLTPLTTHDGASGGSGLNEITMIERKVVAAPSGPSPSPSTPKDSADDDDEEEKKKTTLYVIIGVITVVLLCFMMASMMTMVLI